MRKQYDIPGFSRYVVKRERGQFIVFDKQIGDQVKQHQRKRGYDSVHLYDNQAKRRTLSIVTILALAFHGQQPHGYVAWCYGEFVPSAIQRIPKPQAQGLLRGIAPDTRFQAQEMYFNTGLTQAEIADRLGCSQGAVSRAVNRRY